MRPRNHRGRAVIRCLLAAAAWAVLAAPAGAGQQTLTPLPEAATAPDFDLLDVENRRHRLSDYRGKVVLVNFWATWCPPCRREMPSMQRLWQRLKGRDFALLAVDVGEDDETVFGFIFALDTQIEFPLLLDPGGKVIERWPVLGLPTSFVIDRQGRMVYRAVGGREWDAPELVEKLEALIGP